MAEEIEFSLDQMEDMRDIAGDAANGGTPDPLIATIWSKTGIGYIIGGVLVKFGTIVAEKAAGLYDICFTYFDNLSHNQKVEYYHFYRDTAKTMEKCHHKRVRFAGHFNHESKKIKGETIDYYIITGMPTVSAFQDANGYWRAPINND